jgi:tetratricopeptide (TPR) repeat protein
MMVLRALLMLAGVSCASAAWAAPEEDAQLLLERGWLELRDGKLAQARVSTQRALERATRSEQLAAGAYNLGRIEEASGQLWLADADYRRSLDWRANDSVANRHRSLAARLKRTPWLLSGPYSSLGAICEELATAEDRVRLDAAEDASEPYLCGDCQFTCPDEFLQHMDEGLPPPIAELSIFVSHAQDRQPQPRNHSSGSDYDEVFLNVAVRIGEQWFVAAALDPQVDWGGKIELLELAVKAPTRAHAPMLLLRFSASHGNSLTFQENEEYVAILGVGASGKPSLLSPVSVAKEEHSFTYGDDDCHNERARGTKRRWQLTSRALLVTREVTTDEQCGKTQRRERSLSERSSLEFP